MALYSMTGFGQAVVDHESHRVKVEIRSVNHRFAEFNMRVPRDLLLLEEEIRSRLSARIQRGRTDVYVSAETLAGAADSLRVNWELFDALCKVQAEAALRRGGEVPSSPESWTAWLTFPDVLQVQSASAEAAQLKDAVMNAVDLACDALVAMRQREGERLGRDLCDKLSDLHSIVADMDSLSAQVNEQLREKLLQRLRDLLSEVDEQRLLTEVSILADRSAVDEEIVRLQSHIEEFQSSLDAGSPVGRRLDFIVQEMHREVNTIGSKSSDIRLSKAVVNAKTIIEQLREQVQNVE